MPASGGVATISRTIVRSRVRFFPLLMPKVILFLAVLCSSEVISLPSIVSISRAYF